MIELEIEQGGVMSKGNRRRAHKLNELHEDLERVLYLSEGAELEDGMQEARRLLRKASETAASVARELGEA